MSVLWGAMAGRSAAAADLDAYPPPPVYTEPDPQFEFGTGWYLRGDVSYASEDRIAIDASVGKLRSDWAYGGDVGVGYRVGNMVRLDVTGDYLEPFDARRTTDFGGIAERDSLHVDRYAALVNGYLDLGTWYGLTPYLGAGVGLGILDPGTKTVLTDDATGAQTVARQSRPDQINLAWAVMGGVSYAVDPNLSVDLGYRHLDLGRFATAVAGTPVAHDMSRDEVRLGLRYALD